MVDRGQHVDKRRPAPVSKQRSTESFAPPGRPARIHRQHHVSCSGEEVAIGREGVVILRNRTTVYPEQCWVLEPAPGCRLKPGWEVHEHLDWKRKQCVSEIPVNLGVVEIDCVCLPSSFTVSLMIYVTPTFSYGRSSLHSKETFSTLPSRSSDSHASFTLVNLRRPPVVEDAMV